MSSHRIEFVVYLVGLAPLGLFQAAARTAIGHDGIAFAAAIVYLVSLRVIGRALARRFGRDDEPRN